MFFFLWFLFCLLSCWFVLALGNWIVYGLCKGPHLLSFVAFFTDGFACISIQFPASRSLCNDLAKALEALDGKKAKSQDGQQKGTLAHVKRKVATALSMKVKPVKKYSHSCAFAPISAVEACLENSPSSLHFLFCCNFYSLEAASKPALKPAARLILKDCLFCSKFAWSRTGVATEDANAFFPSCRKRAVLR